MLKKNLELGIQIKVLLGALTRQINVHEEILIWRTHEGADERHLSEPPIHWFEVMLDTLYPDGTWSWVENKHIKLDAFIIF